MRHRQGSVGFGRGLAFLLWGLLLWCGVPSSAWAQTAAPGEGQQLETIRKYMEEGQALYLAKDYAAAAKQFEAGYAEHPYSAFLFNAAVCYQKLDQPEAAITKFQDYLRVDPQAPDAAKVQERLQLLEQVVDARRRAAEAEAAAAARAAATPPGPEGTPPAEPLPPAEPAVAVPVIPETEMDTMRSLVVVETEPSGAPIAIYAPTSSASPPFVLGQANPGWTRIQAASSPMSVTLPVGRYQVVVEKFRDFNASDTVIDVSPGHVHHFKANLSQGAFMAFLRVSANVRGAYIYLDDDMTREWGTTPYGELIAAGKHSLIVEAPGFQSLRTEVELKHGEQLDLDVDLARVNYGILSISADVPEVRVEIDAKPVGIWRQGEAALQVQVPSGPHRLELKADGRKTFEGEVEVPKGLILPVKAKMIEKYPRGTAWTEAILAAAFVGGGVYLEVEAKNIHDQAEADKANNVLDSADSRFTKGRIFSYSAIGAFVIGGVLAGLSTYNFIKDPYPDSSTKYGNVLEFPDPKALRPRAESSPLSLTGVDLALGPDSRSGFVSLQGTF